jgi:hypothetical protein
MEPVNVSGINNSYLALHGNGELWLRGRWRHRVGIRKIFVRFERQLHIALIVSIMMRLITDVMLCYETPEGSVTMLSHMFLYMCKKDGNFEQLVTLCGIAQIDGKE